MADTTIAVGALVTFSRPACFGSRRRAKTSGHACPYRCKERTGQRALIAETNRGALHLVFGDGASFWAEPTEVERV